MLICIDAGHGGKDNGAQWGDKYDYVEEDDLNLIISFLLRYELLFAGHTTQLTREKDKLVALRDRVLIANNMNADLFLSIHADAFHNTTAKGITTHVYPNCSKSTRSFAERIQSELIKSFPSHTNRGVKESNFYVLRKTKMPAILIECEFLSNPKTRRFLKEPENQLAIAQAITEGIDKYCDDEDEEEKEETK